MDDLDRQLVALLRTNARAATADLARQLDIARTTQRWFVHAATDK